jgi:hypothetical protein
MAVGIKGEGFNRSFVSNINIRHLPPPFRQESIHDTISPNETQK